MGCASAYQNPCRSIEPVGFSGLNGAQFGAEVELTGGVVYVGAPGLARLYSVNVAGGGYGYWGTNFGTPLVATSYGGGYTSINEILYNNGVQWSGVDNALGITPNGARIIRSDPYADYDNGNDGSITDTGSSALYINGSLIGTLSSGDNSIKVFGLAPVFPAEAHYVIGTYNANRLFNFRQFGPVWTYTGSIVPEALPTSKFGSSVAIDGLTAVVGARDYDNRGAAFVFVRDGVEAETWSLQAKLQGLDTNMGNWFGSSVGVSGNTIIVGAPNANQDASGAAYIFERIGTTWIQQAKLIASDSTAYRLFGLTSAISVDSAAVGAPGGDAVYVFVRSGFAWMEQQIISGASGFGLALALNADTLLVGSPRENSNTGAAYVYTRANSLWTEQAQLTAGDGVAGDQFGAAVALDGNHAAVGAPGYQNAMGAVYAFTQADALWSVPEKLTLASGAAGDHFGNSISISANRMVIGAYLRDVARTSGGVTTTYTDEGSAYAYGLNKEGLWILETAVEALQASDGYSGDMLGYAVAISGTLVLTGAPQFNGRIGGLPTDGGGYIYITEISPPLAVTQPAAVETILNGAKAQKIRDTANSISPLYFFDVPSFTLDLSAGDKNDTITVNSDGLSAYALSSFIIKTGGGDDTLNVNSSSVRLPTAGKVRASAELLSRSAGQQLTGDEAAQLYDTISTLFQFIAGDGSNTLNIPAADTDFTLSDTELFDSAGGKLSLDGVSNISLTGGPSANVFDILSWSGTVTLDGLGGSDRYLVNLGAVHTLNLSDSGSGPSDQDRLVVLGTDNNETISILAVSITAGSSTLNYSNIEALTVAGLGGDDTLILNDLGVHEVSLDGGQGSDSYQINVAGSTLNVYTYDSGSVGTDQLFINGSAADDTFVVDTTQATLNSAVITYDDSFEQFTVNGCAGNDRFTINAHPPVITNFLGGTGDDRFDVYSVKPNGIQLIDGQDGNDIYWLVDPTALLGPVAIADSGAASDEDFLVQAASANADSITVTASGITGMPANSADFSAFSGLEGLGIDLLGGDDTISISGTPNGIALAVYGSDGNDSVFLANLSTLSNYNLRFFGMAGTDSLTIDASTGSSGTLSASTLTGFNLLKSLIYETFETITLNLSAGNDTLTVTTTGDLSTVVVNALAGLDQVTVVNTGAGSSLTVNLGSGDDQLTLQAAGLNSIVQLNGEDGGDTFVIQSSPASSNLEINGGAGMDRFTFNGASDTTVLNAGADNDTVTVNSAGGNTTINGNEGDDVIHINKTDLSVDFHGIIDGQGGEDTLTFAGYSSGRDFLLTGLGAADGFNLAVTGIDALFKNINTLAGSAFADTLTGLAAASSWNLTGAKSGAYTSSAISLAFSAIESLLGGSGADSFIVADGIAFGGTINGGLGSNTLSYVGSASVHSVSLSGASSNGGFNGSATGIDGFSNINSLLAGSGSDTLTGLNAIANWIVTAANVLTYSSGSQSLFVSGFKSLIGGSGLDTLSFASLSAVQAMTVLALGSVDGFKLASAYFTGASFDNINTLTGGSGADSLAGLDATSSWNLTGAKTGTYTSSAISLAFSAIESLLGGTAADSFLVSAAAFGGTLDGGLGSDTLSYLGSASAHLVTLSGAGTNGLNGTASGIDGFSNIDILLGGTGLDTLTGPNVDTVWTLSGSPSLTSGGQTLTFTGFETLRGGSAGDTFRHTVSTPLTFNLDGGLGEDTFDYSAWSNPVTLNLAAGTATALVGTLTGIEDLIGGSGNDTLTGDGGNNILTGSAGTDTLAGGAGNDTYRFGNDWGSEIPLTGLGSDAFDFSAVTVPLTFTFSLTGLTISDGVNIITHTGGFVKNLVGGSAADSFIYNASVTFNGSLDGRGGSDTLDFSAYTTAMLFSLTGSNPDGFSGSAGSALTSFAGINSLFSGAGVDTLTGLNSDSTWTINSVCNLDTSTCTYQSSGQTLNFARLENLSGGSQADIFAFVDAGSMTGTVSGGAGNDTLDYGGYSTPVTVNLGDGTVTGTAGISSLENFIGSPFGNIVYGDAGNNILIGAGSADKLYGLGGDDILIGLGGNDLLDGGAGNDTLDYSGNLISGVTVNLVSGTALSDDSGNDSLISIENVIGTQFADTITGDANANRLTGGAGNDTLTGGAGDDTYLFGDNSGSDTLIEAVGGGIDTLDFSPGTIGLTLTIDSVLAALFENIIGTSGNDIFVFSNGVHWTGSINGLGGADELRLSNSTSPLAFVLSGQGALDGFDGSVTGVHDSFVNINQLTGGTSGADSLTGLASGQWQVLTATSAQYTSVSTLGISGIETLIGGSGSDALSFAPALGALSVTMTGLGAAGGFDLTASGFSGAFRNMDGVTGSAGSDTFSGANLVSTWQLSQDASVYTSGGHSLNFSAFENLNGGSAADTFQMLAFTTAVIHLSGGGDSDTLDYAAYATGVTVNLSTGFATDTTGITGIEHVTGGSGNDTLTGNGGDNRLNGGVGSDTLNYSASTASVTIDLGLGTVSGTSIGTDTLISIESIIGSPFTDSLIGLASGQWQILTATSGQYTSGSTLNFADIETLIGGSGADALSFAPALGALSVTVTGLGAAGGFDLTASGFTGAFRNMDGVTGSAGSDTFTGANLVSAWQLSQGVSVYTSGGHSLNFSSFENLNGGSAADTFQMLAFTTALIHLSGGGDSDTLDYSAYATSVTVNLSTGVATDTTGITGIEHVTGGSGNDMLTGNGSDNRLNGGAGSDTLNYSASTASVTVDLGLGTATGASIGSDTLISIENVIGSPFADTLTGSDSDNLLTGGAGNDTLIGLNGSDTYQFGDNAGSDTIIELLTGGSGDTFDFSACSTDRSLSINEALAALIENFIGGAGNDTFIMASGVTLVGYIDGQGGSNTLDLSANSIPLPVTLTGLGAAVGFAGSASVLGAGFTNITNLLGSNASGNILTGADLTANWTLSPTTTSVSSANHSLNFSGFDGMTGGAGDDSFTLSGQISYALDGGAGNDRFVFMDGSVLQADLEGGPGLDTLDFSNFTTARSIKLTSYSHDDDAFIGRDASLIPALTGTFSNINGLIGSSDPTNSDSLTGLDYDAHWNLGNGGTYAVNPTLTFSSFKTLVGGSGSDTFEVSGTQDVSIQGQAGDDVFIFNPGSQVNELDGGAGNDQIEFRTYGNITIEPGANPYVLTKIDGVEVEIVIVVNLSPVVAVTAANNENSDRGSGSQSVATFISQNIVLLANGSSTLQLANGIQVSFAARVGTLANISLLQPGNLPSLPGKYGYRSGLNIQVWNGSQSVAVLKHGMTVSFALPVDTGAGHNLILFWDQSANNGLGGWAEVTTTLVSRLVNGVIVSTLEVTSTNTGTYILVTETNPSAAGN